MWIDKHINPRETEPCLINVVANNIEKCVFASTGQFIGTKIMWFIIHMWRRNMDDLDLIIAGDRISSVNRMQFRYRA